MHSEEALCRSFKYKRQYRKNILSNHFSYKICIVDGKTLTSTIDIKTNLITKTVSISSGVKYYHKYIGPEKYGKINCYNKECQKKYTNSSNKYSKNWQRVNKCQKEKLFTIRMGKEDNKILSSQTRITVNTHTDNILIKPYIYYSGKILLLRP